MSIESRELTLFIINDGKLFEKVTSPACVNLAGKMRKGIFDAEKAKVMFYHVAEAGAKEYNRVFGSKDIAWNVMFPTQDRRECASELLEHYMEGIQELAQ